MNIQYSTRVLSPEGLSAADREAMLQLYLSHYDASGRDLFLSDLDRKSEVLLVLDGTRIAGFTTLEYYPWVHGSQTLQIVYSGDTIVDPMDWGQQALAFAWIRRVAGLKQAYPDRPLYWLLIVKGHRTFKYLPTFGKTFFPHWEDRNRDWEALAADLARAKFGEHYNPRTGVVEFPSSRGHLKPEIAEPSPHELQKACVRYFMEKNPGYRSGHELVCLCPLEEENMRPLTLRLFRQADAA